MKMVMIMMMMMTVMMTVMMMILMILMMVMSTWLMRRLLYHDLGLLAPLSTHHHFHCCPLPPFILLNWLVIIVVSAIIVVNIVIAIIVVIVIIAIIVIISPAHLHQQHISTFTFRLAISLLRLDTWNRNQIVSLLANINLGQTLFLSNKYSGLELLEVMGWVEKHVDVYFSD